MTSHDFRKICEHAREVLFRKGEVKQEVCLGYIGCLCFVYEDEVVKIVSTTERCRNEEAGLLEIVRKENNNPVLMADEKNYKIRYHGEFSYIEEHFFSL